MKKSLGFLAIALGMLMAAPSAHAQLGTATGTTTLTVTVAAEAALTVGGGGSTALTSTGTNFTNFIGSTSLTYFIRTTASGGTGTLSLKVTSDFSPAGGPSVTTPPTTGDALSYTSTVSNPGNNGAAVPENHTASTAASTNIATFGADSRSLVTGNSATVNWTLTNDPKYKTGSYSATVTFTISAT